MADLCRNTPVPIALDEELIGVIDSEQRASLLDTIEHQILIIKPALVGGFGNSQEWINLAGVRDIGWWLTSALESNIGLNAIAQFTYTMGIDLPQGLGTGNLFVNNIPSPLEVKKGALHCNDSSLWDTNSLNF